MIAPNETIRILIADDHPLVMDGIKSCLEVYDHIDVAGTATNGREAIDRADALNVDVVVMDINMPELNGLDAGELLKEKRPDIKLLFLSMHDNRDYITSAVQSGAQGYVLKDVPSEEIVTAIEAVHGGGTYFSSGVSEVLSRARMEKQRSPLTTREQTILLLLARGMSNKEVARHLDISVRTAETHRRNIKTKLQIGSTAGLTEYAIRNGILKSGG